jgi:6-phosphogluconolactonase
MKIKPYYPIFLFLITVNIFFTYAQVKPDNSFDMTAKSKLVYVGTYTEKEANVSGKAEGIYIYELNLTTGELSYISTSPRTMNPSYIAIHPNHQWLYAVNEFGEGQVSAFLLSTDKKQLTFLNAVSSHGNSPCYVSVDHSGKFVMVANYGSGTVALYPINPDGSLQDASSVDQHAGKGPTARQEGPHAHMIIPGNSGQYIYATDLGTDQVFTYRIDSKTKQLKNTGNTKTTQAGAGPRHLAFHPNNLWVYLVNELNGTIEASSVNNLTGEFKRFQTISTVPEDEKNAAGCADIHITPSGKFLYASNRGDVNTIAMYAINQNTGQLQTIGYQSVLGRTPRSFVIDPTGTFLLVANQGTDNVVTFKIDTSTGKLIETGIETKIPTPVCLKIME